MNTPVDEVITDDQAKPRRGLKPGQRHSGSFTSGFDPRRRGYYYDGKSFAQMAAEHAPECLDLWVRAVGDEDAPWAIRLRASELIVERAYGKAASVIDMQVTHNRPLSAMTDDELLGIVSADSSRPALTIDAAVHAEVPLELAVALPVDVQDPEEAP